jgi:hypothetical protein
MWKFYAVRVTGRSMAKRFAAYPVRDKAGLAHPCEQRANQFNRLYRRYKMQDISKLTTQTMTSMEVVKIINEMREEGQAELAHSDFMKKAVKVIGEGIGNYSDTYVHPQNGQTYPCYRLPKREVHLMVMSESYKIQAAIYDRWQELEERESKPEIPQTQGQFLVMIAQSFADQERKLLELSAAHSETKAATERNERRLDQLETASDHFTVLGYHLYLHKERLTLPDAARIGAVASKYCKQHEVPMGEVPDPRFGRVKTYPRWVLDEITKTIQ